MHRELLQCICTIFSPFTQKIRLIQKVFSFSYFHEFILLYQFSDSPGGSIINNDKDCFIYPDLKTCLVGKFNEKSRAVKAKQARIVGLCEEKVKINFLTVQFPVTENISLRM